MEQTRITRLYVRRHPVTALQTAVLGDPEGVIMTSLDKIPFGATVELVFPATEADHPLDYHYQWYGLRRDIRWIFAGHLNAWIYELVAKLKNGAWS